MNIAFAGLTAAGKTTHAKLLAEDLGYEVIEATPILLRLLDISDPNPTGVWLRHHNLSERLRDDDQADDALEAELVSLASSTTRTIFDTWALPWLSTAPLIRLWLSSDVQSRAFKVSVSQPEENLTLLDCAYHAGNKDEATRQRFRRRHGFDLYSNHNIFDVVLDNSSMISEPTRRAADDGIRRFRPFVLGAVTWLVESDPSILTRLQQQDPLQFEHTVMRLRGWPR